MPFTLCAFNHDEWIRHGLADFGEFADQISECYVGEDSFSGYGKWFFVPEKPLPNGDRVIYFGTWGNENAPGASCHTHAEIFNMGTDDAKAFERRVRDWESQPEYADDSMDDEEGENWDDDEQPDDDIPF